MLYCDRCEDVKSLRTTLRSCHCGEVSAKYTGESNHVHWNGNGAILAVDSDELSVNYAGQSISGRFKQMQLLMLRPDSSTIRVIKNLGKG